MVRLQRALLRASLTIPARFRKKLVGAPAVNGRGDVLDFDVHWMLALERRLGPGIAEKTVEKSRRGMRESVRIVEAEKPAMQAIEDVDIAGVSCRRYQPGPEPRGRLMYLHGGGWTVGDLDSHDGFCRRIAADTGLEVIAVDYALAPERPFPHGLNDAVAVFGEFRKQPGLLILGGDSAGGNLAAVSCLVLRRDGQAMPDLQLLIYPATDQTRSHASHVELGMGFMLEKTSVDWYIEQYGGEATEPLVSPFFAEDLTGLPEALVVTAGFDPLRDEGEAYAARLEAAGVRVTSLDASDMVHGYVHMDGQIAAANERVAELTGALRDWVTAHTAS